MVPYSSFSLFHSQHSQSQSTTVLPPPDENSNSLHVTSNGRQLDRFKSASTSSLHPTADPPQPDTPSDGMDTRRPLERSPSDSSKLQDQLAELKTPEPDAKPMGGGVYNRMRRLSMKVGALSSNIGKNRHKPERSSLSALPLSTNSSGFFSDQKETSRVKSKHGKPWCRSDRRTSLR